MSIFKVFASSAITLFALTSTAGAADVETVATGLGAHKVTNVSFDKGTAALTDSEKGDLSSAISDARSKGKIQEIKVLAWADREYPQNGEKAAKQDVSLAENRADVIKNYLKKELDVSKVTVYNMAKRPNTIQELFKTSDDRVKQALEANGAIQTSGKTDGSSQASSALVMVISR